VLVPYTTAEFTVKYPTFIVAMFARGTVRVEATFMYCVLTYGIVNVSKKNVAFAAFAVNDPLTLNVSMTVTFVRFDVP
jgi:hypothetical protein